MSRRCMPSEWPRQTVTPVVARKRTSAPVVKTNGAVKAATVIVPIHRDLTGCQWTLPATALVSAASTMRGERKVLSDRRSASSTASCDGAGLALSPHPAEASASVAVMAISFCPSKARRGGIDPVPPAGHAGDLGLHPVPVAFGSVAVDDAAVEALMRAQARLLVGALAELHDHRRRIGFHQSRLLAPSLPESQHGSRAVRGSRPFAAQDSRSGRLRQRRAPANRPLSCYSVGQQFVERHHPFGNDSGVSFERGSAKILGKVVSCPVSYSRVRVALACGLALLAAASSPPSLSAEERSDQIVAARLAEFLRSARTVISQYQDLINDPTKGDKGLTGEKVLAEATAIYKKQTGEDPAAVDPASREGKLLRAQSEAIMDVMAENQAHDQRSRMSVSRGSFRRSSPGWSTRNSRRRPGARP